MPKYTKPLDPLDAVARFERQPGNYILHFGDGSAYPGRQGERSRRLSTHLRTKPDLTAVQFLEDHHGDPCLRADRERQTLDELIAAEVPVRNRIQPSRPSSCALPSTQRTTRCSDSGLCEVLAAAGAVAEVAILFGAMVAALSSDT